MKYQIWCSQTFSASRQQFSILRELAAATKTVARPAAARNSHRQGLPLWPSAECPRTAATSSTSPSTTPARLPRPRHQPRYASRSCGRGSIGRGLQARIGSLGPHPGPVHRPALRVRRCKNANRRADPTPRRRSGRTNAAQVLESALPRVQPPNPRPRTWPGGRSRQQGTGVQRFRNLLPLLPSGSPWAADRRQRPGPGHEGRVCRVPISTAARKAEAQIRVYFRTRGTQTRRIQRVNNVFINSPTNSQAKITSSDVTSSLDHESSVEPGRQVDHKSGRPRFGGRETRKHYLMTTVVLSRFCSFSWTSIISALLCHRCNNDLKRFEAQLGEQKAELYFPVLYFAEPTRLWSPPFIILQQKIKNKK